MVVRKQNFGLCFLYAVVVMESYLIAIATECDERKIGTIDIGRYEAETLAGESLRNFYDS